jgi:hypothetical protein
MCQGVAVLLAIVSLACNAATAPSTKRPLVITPAVPAGGQMVTLEGIDVPLVGDLTATIAQGASVDSGFVFVRSGNLVTVRLPFGLMPGAATLTLADGGDYQAVQPFTVAATPAAPVIGAVFALAMAPTAGSPCGGSLANVVPITTIARGQGIAVAAAGLDTIGVFIRFRQGALTVEQEGTCGIAGEPILTIARGGSQAVAVPSNLAPGPATIEVSVDVRGVRSPFSAPMSVTIS